MINTFSLKLIGRNFNPKLASSKCIANRATQTDLRTNRLSCLFTENGNFSFYGFDLHILIISSG